MALFALITIALVVLLVIQQRWAKRGIPQPVFIPEKIPLLSHAIGVGRHGAMYYKSISERTRLPIFGLKVFTQTFYVVTDTSLISKIQRHPTISFDPFVLLAAERLCGASQSMLDRMHKETRNGKSTRSSLVNESHVLTHAMFRSPLNLSSMVGKILDVVSHEAAPPANGNLFQWIRHAVCIASTDAVYGPKNPFRINPHLEDSFWDYDADLSLLLLNFIPSVTARKGYLAKKALRRAFTDYFQNGGSEQASTFVQACSEANRKRGISEEDQAGFEVVHCIGLLVNTPPTLFWIIYHIYSDASLLERLRTELLASLNPDHLEGSPSRILDIEKLSNDDSLLQSTLKEVLRVHASSLSTRIVLEDTSIGNDILLKKDSIVHMPSACLHSDAKHFGQNASSFDATRFLSAQWSKEAAGPKAQVAYRPFGGGSTLCPGRHFATMQILSITAMILLTFDVVPESGAWVRPKSLESTMTTTVLPPVDDIRVRFQRRHDEKVGTVRFASRHDGGELV